MNIRKATNHDALLLFLWANDKEAREMAFSSDPIEWAAHVKWFANKLADKNCTIYIGLNNKNEPVGQVRFDLDTVGEAEVDVHINPELRGRGYGSALLASAVNHYLCNEWLTAIHAWIKAENIKSLRLFSSLGFAETSKKMVQQTLCYHLVKRKNLSK